MHTEDKMLGSIGAKGTSARRTRRHNLPNKNTMLTAQGRERCDIGTSFMTASCQRSADALVLVVDTRGHWSLLSRVLRAKVLPQQSRQLEVLTGVYPYPPQLPRAPPLMTPISHFSHLTYSFVTSILWLPC